MRSIWAIAANTIKQALRMKVAAVFTILLFVLLPVMAVTMTGDGTIKGRLQSFVSYGLSLTSFLLCLLTIIVSIYSLTSDFRQRQIYTVITKPVRRFEILFGKFLGVILLDVVLLVVFSSIIYAVAVYMPRFLNASQTELTGLANEFYTARAGLIPAEPDVTEAVQQTYKRLEETDRLPSGMSRDNIIAQLTRNKKLEKRSAGPGGDLLWEFHNVKPIDPNQSLFIRFKYNVSVNPPDLQLYSKWVVGDIRQIRYAMKIKTPVRDFDRKDLIRTFHEIQVPADVVADDGYLAIGFFNVPLNNTVVIFPPKDGLEVLYKADSFGANFLRAVLLILFRLIFIASLGVLASSFLSFPVAVLLCLVVFFTANISGFIIESFSFLNENMSSVYSYTVKPAISFIPQFDKFNPAKFMVSARLLSWPLLARVAFFMVCIKAFLLLLLALLIFSFREIAKITV